MITAIVQFLLPEGLDRDTAAALYEGSAPAYRAAPGLIRKYYLYGEESRTGGGVYIWRSRADADRFYSAAWREGMVRAVGSAPRITFFETPVVVDNQLARAA